MQTESMMRLLRKDEDSPSGYEIVGKLWMHYDEDRHAMVEDWEVIVPDEEQAATGLWIEGFDDDNWVTYDAFEMGILGDEWWFAGDVGLHGVLNSPTINHGWVFMSQGTSCDFWTIINPKRIGTIHDKEESDAD